MKSLQIIARNDYFEQLDYIYTEQNRHNNEKDPELSNYI